jgi:hypothetical protein
MTIQRSLVLFLLSSPSQINPLLFGTKTRSLTRMAASAQSTEKEYYRSDGVRITHDPYAPGMAKKYGLQGETDPEGFDPYADSVGPGIYGGSVKRDEKTGEVLWGPQYQNHNPIDGPLYDGNGYSLMSRAIHKGPEYVKKLLVDFPELKDDLTTGGALPLHICGMSRQGQLSTQVLIDAGADLHALDTYNYNALHRMASNDLEVGGEALVKAGMDPNHKPALSDSSPIDIAKRSRAIKFLMAMQRLGHYD